MTFQEIEGVKLALCNFTGMIFESNKLSAICRLGFVINSIQKEDALIQKAEKANPWFSAFFILESLKAIEKWFGEDRIVKFMVNRECSGREKSVGIVMAGNLPLVGFHDLLIALLAGHRAIVHLSKKDAVLMPAIVEKWKETDPEWAEKVTFERLEEEIKETNGNFGKRKVLCQWDKIDFLLATGSDNTARQLGHRFEKIPHFIRKNRFSVALLTGEESQTQLRNLARDLFLYNGMGCRNISNLLIPKTYDLKPLIKALDSYPVSQISTLYLEMMAWNKAEFAFSTESKFSPKNQPNYLILKPDKTITGTKPGILNLVTYRTIAEAKELIANAMEHIQCIVGEGFTPFGQAQQPNLDNFADGVNTFDLLKRI